jgi:hypothetical protein
MFGALVQRVLRLSRVVTGAAGGGAAPLSTLLMSAEDRRLFIATAGHCSTSIEVDR